MSDQIDDDEFTDVDDLLRWIGHARTEARALRAERDALRARAETAEAALATARAGAICVCGCASGHLCACDEDGLCTDCGCDVVVVVDQHSADIVTQLRQERDAAEAALATARAEGAAAERAAWLTELRADLLSLEVIKADAEDYVRELIEDIEAGAHVRPVEGA